ncbi:MAG: hypothetical protein GC153_08490 [Alphaproteobacteria bacterium]|nr:hypothetical protein [Alphaproteobacteria bacterium]
MKRRVALLVSSILLSFSSGAFAFNGTKAERKGEAPAVRKFALGPIAESNVPKGECGMVLWTLDDSQPMPILRYLSGKGGEISVGGVPVVLTIAETSGASAFGVSEHQVFSTTVGLKVTVDMHFSTGFDGGSYLQQGIVRVEAPDGWRIIAPSAGVAGCRAK